MSRLSRRGKVSYLFGITPWQAWVRCSVRTRTYENPKPHGGHFEVGKISVWIFVIFRVRTSTDASNVGSHTHKHQSSA